MQITHIDGYCYGCMIIGQCVNVNFEKFYIQLCKDCAYKIAMKTLEQTKTLLPVNKVYADRTE